MLQDVGSLNEFGQLCLFPKNDEEAFFVVRPKWASCTFLCYAISVVNNGMLMAEKNILILVHILFKWDFRPSGL